MAPRPTDDDLDFTGGFAAYKPPSGASTAPAAVPVPAGPSQNFDQATAEIAQRLAREGFHVLKGCGPSGERRPRAVFLVDADAAAQTRATKALASAGIQTVAARDARTTSRVLSRSAVPGMFLVDVALPGGVDGFALLRLIRKHPALGAVPVVMSLPHDSRHEILRGLIDGADGYLAKNSPPEALLKIARAILGD